jgi:hypothetical protein
MSPVPGGRSGDLRQGLGLGAGVDRGHIRQRLLLPLCEGACANVLHLLGGEEALRSRRGVRNVSAAVKDGVEAEFLEDGFSHQ